VACSGLPREGQGVLPVQEPRALPEVQQEEAQLVRERERRLRTSPHPRRTEEKDKNNE